MKKITPYLRNHGMSLILFGLIFLTSCGGGGGNESPQTPVAQEAQKQLTESFTIGATWDAKALSNDMIRERNEFLTAKAAYNTVKITTLHEMGTGFFLGKTLGHYIIATNAHVLRNVASCNFSSVFIHFPFANKIYTCDQLIGIWADVDFALLALRIKDKRSDFLDNLNPFQLAPMRDEIRQGEPLLSLGFGSAQNENGNMTIKEDSLCTPLSSQIKRLDNGDQRIPRKIPSFAVGCDLSPGDSGSALVDKRSGKVKGIVWSIMKPKSPFVRSQTFMEGVLSETDPGVWNDFGYAVPVRDIRQSLQRWVNRVEISIPMRKRRRIVLEILDR